MVRVHLQVYILWVCVCMLLFQAHGTLFEARGVCSPQLFSAHNHMRSGGLEDRLLTTLPYLPTPSPAFATGTRHWWKERREAERSPTPPHPSFWTSLTVPASSLPAHTSVCLSTSAICLLSQWQCSLMFVYFHNWLSDSWMSSGGAAE